MNLLDVNLQLFAEGEETELETVQGMTEQETDIEETQDIEEIEEVEEKKEDRVPLNKYLDEKKRRRDLEKRLRDLEDSQLSYQHKQEIDDIKKIVKEKGYDDDFADLLSEVTNKLLKSVPKVDKVEQEILEDIQDYADENPEVLKHKKEIIEKVKKYRKADPDFSVEDALNLIKPSKVRVGELKTDIEQKQAIARRNVEGKKVATASSSSPKNPYPLDEADKKALKGLQDLMPDAGWTIEKYYKSRYNK
jgi:hypothetical protein